MQDKKSGLKTEPPAVILIALDSRKIVNDLGTAKVFSQPSGRWGAPWT